MPHFLLSHATGGPIIDVVITVSAPRYQVLQAAGLHIPAPQPCKALVDTGASHTTIDPVITQALGLSATGYTQIITPTTGQTPVQLPTYDVGLHIPFGNQQFHTRNPSTVSSAALLHQGFAVLLGRDIMADGLLIYDGKHNLITLSF